MTTKDKLKDYHDIRTRKCHGDVNLLILEINGKLIIISILIIIIKAIKRTALLIELFLISMFIEYFMR